MYATVKVKCEWENACMNKLNGSHTDIVKANSVIGKREDLNIKISQLI